MKLFIFLFRISMNSSGLLIDPSSETKETNKLSPKEEIANPYLRSPIFGMKATKASIFELPKKSGFLGPGADEIIKEILLSKNGRDYWPRSNGNCFKSHKKYSVPVPKFEPIEALIFCWLISNAFLKSLTTGNSTVKGTNPFPNVISSFDPGNGLVEKVVTIVIFSRLSPYKSLYSFKVWLKTL